MTSTAKDQVRKHWVESRQRLDSDARSLFNREIKKNLRFFWSESGALKAQERKPVWCGFKAMTVEPDVDEAIQETTTFFGWAFPKVTGETIMEFRVPAASEPRWLRSSLGTWEPDPLTSEVIPLKNCFGVLVPGVAFDRRGGRLGSGKGFYDRALEGYSGLKVGVCFSTQVSETELPTVPTDVAMDALVTDKEILFFRR